MEPCLETHPLDPVGVTWLEDIFRRNMIDIRAFLRDVDMILSNAHPKIKTLFLEGVSNAGKTLIQELVCSNQGTVGYAELRDRNLFQLEPLVGADIAVISEFLAIPQNVPIAKRLFGGEKFPIQQKNKKQVLHKAMPVIVTAQEGWNTWMGYGDLVAVMNRCKYYKFTHAAPEAPVRICPCYWQHVQEKHRRGGGLDFGDEEGQENQ